MSKKTSSILYVQNTVLSMCSHSLPSPHSVWEKWAQFCTINAFCLPLPIGDILSLCEVMNYAITRAWPAKLPFNSKYRWGARAGKVVTMMPSWRLQRMWRHSLMNCIRRTPADCGSYRNGLASLTRCMVGKDCDYTSVVRLFVKHNSRSESWTQLF